MGIKDYGKLAKLKIISVNTNEAFDVMFNPESYSETFAVTYKKAESANGGLEGLQYIKTPPQDFKLKVIIDTTGVTDYDSSIIPIFKRTGETVYDQVNRFLKLTWYPVNDKSIPLQIVWGKFSYHCLLKEVTINYTLFDRDGIPLRAELDASFISNPDGYAADCQERLSPDKPKEDNSKTTKNGIVISVS